MMKRSTKYTIKKGKVVLNKPAKPRAKLTDYERYVNIARDNGVPKSELLTEAEYNTVVVSNKQRNIAAKPDSIVRQQLRDGVTDKQYRAALDVARRKDPTMTRKKFTKIRGWEPINDYVSKYYKELKDKYPMFTTETLSGIISTEIYGSE